MRWVRGWLVWFGDAPASYLMATAAIAILVGRVGAALVMALLT